MAVPLKINTLVQFDRSIFKRNWKRVNGDPLRRSGLTVRRIAINSIRKDHIRKKTGLASGIPSAAGKPPKSRALGHPFRRIFSDVARIQASVIIGPVGFGAFKPVTELHEFGGNRPANMVRVPGFVMEDRRNKRLAAAGVTGNRSRRRRRFDRAKVRDQDEKDAIQDWYWTKDEQLGGGWQKDLRMRGRNYPARPYMWPALIKAQPYIAQNWKFAYKNAKGLIRYSPTMKRF